MKLTDTISDLIIKRDDAIRGLRYMFNEGYSFAYLSPLLERIINKANVIKQLVEAIDILKAIAEDWNEKIVTKDKEPK